MTDRYVRFVVGDIGGTKEVVPVARAMGQKGWLIRIAADPEGKGKGRLSTEILPGILDDDASPRDPDDLYGIVIGTSATAVKSQIEWTVFGKTHGIPVVWIEDMYGTASRPAVMGVDPDRLFVMDYVAYEVARAARKETVIHVFGKPSMAATLEKLERRDEIRRRIRKSLELRNVDSRDRALLVTYWSGGEDPRRVEGQLRAVTQLTGAGGRKMRIAIRLHPKIGDENRKALIGIAKVGQNWLAPSESVVAADADELAIASDLNIADWGGAQGLVSVLADISTVITLFPDDSLKRKSVFPPAGLPPLVVCGAAFGVTSPASLFERVEEVFSSRSGPLPHVEPPLSLRPLLQKDAAERIGAEIAHLLRNPPRSAG